MICISAQISSGFCGFRKLKPTLSLCSVSKQVSPFSVKVRNAEGSLRQVDEMSVGFIRTEDPCIQFKMAVASLMRGFSRWQFGVLGRKTGFQYCESKEQLRSTWLL